MTFNMIKDYIHIPKPPFIPTCTLCHRIFLIGSRDWFRHMLGTCHGKQWDQIKHEY